MTKHRFLTVTFLIFSILLVLGLSSCAGTYELSITGLTGGTVVMEPAGGVYKEGEIVTLTAEPNTGFSFTGWRDISAFSIDSTLSSKVKLVMPAKNVDVSAGFIVPGEGWTFMVYMAGDNTLSNYVYTDLDEIEQGLYDAVSGGNLTIDGDVKVLVLTDRSGSSDSVLFLASPDSSNSSINSIRLDPDFIPASGELNMADPDTLQDFVEYGLAVYPSQYNALVLWNHGGGVKSLEEPEYISKQICEDDGELMYLNEVQTAVTTALGGDRLDIFGIDACIMGEVETAYEMRHIADYFVASMAEEWGYGWGYEHVFDKFTSAGNPPAPAAMADILVSQFYDSTYGNSTYYPNTMTAVDTAALENLKVEIDLLASVIHDFGSGSQAQNEFEAVRDATVFYYEGRPEGQTVVDDDVYEQQILGTPYYDLFDLCTNIADSLDYDSTVKTQAAAVLSALDSAVVANYGDPNGLDFENYYFTDDATAVRGLSILIPHGEMDYDGYSHYAYDWWYTSSSLDGYDFGEIDFCTYDSDGTVETWRELFEAWYDNFPAINSGDGYTGGTF